jgi:hypothetical protein
LPELVFEAFLACAGASLEAPARTACRGRARRAIGTRRRTGAAPNEASVELDIACCARTAREQMCDARTKVSSP